MCKGSVIKKCNRGAYVHVIRVLISYDGGVTMSYGRQGRQIE